MAFCHNESLYFSAILCQYKSHTLVRLALTLWKVLSKISTNSDKTQLNCRPKMVLRINWVRPHHAIWTKHEFSHLIGRRHRRSCRCVFVGVGRLLLFSRPTSWRFINRREKIDLPILEMNKKATTTLPNKVDVFAHRRNEWNTRAHVEIKPNEDEYSSKSSMKRLAEMCLLNSTTKKNVHTPHTPSSVSCYMQRCAHFSQCNKKPISKQNKQTKQNETQRTTTTFR